MKFWRKNAQKAELNKASEEGKKKRLRLPLRAYLYYALVISIALTGVTFSRYISTTNMSGNVQVASFIITPSGATGNTVSLGRQHGTSSTYSFTVSNENANNEVCEVSADYTIQVVINSALVSKYNAGFTVTVDGNAPTSTSSADGDLTLNFAGKSFDAGVSATNSHTLQINVTATQLSTATVKDQISVNVYVEQVIGS